MIVALPMHGLELSSWHAAARCGGGVADSARHVVIVLPG